MSTLTDYIWYVNGNYMTADQAQLPMTDIGLVRGYGIFDLFRTYGRKPFRMREHLDRLNRSADEIKLQLPHTLGEIGEIIMDTLERNNKDDVVVRIVVTGGDADDFFTPTGNSRMTIMVTPAKRLPPELYATGGKLATVQMGRGEFPTVKSLNYIPAIVAAQQATQKGAMDGVYVNSAGHVLEATRSNLFGIRDGQLFTPKDEILFGITRQATLEVAREVMEVVEAPIMLSELHTFDEVFLTSSTKEIFPISQIDDIIFGNGRPGPMTGRLSDLLLQSIAGAPDI